MNPEQHPSVPPTPKEYWDDHEWVHQHVSEIAEENPNQWVAVVDKRVVAAGKVIAEVREEAEQKIGRKHFPVIFAEIGIHVYERLQG